MEREITRYGGLNPFGKPNWRVVLGQNVREQCFGTMRHMPCEMFGGVSRVANR